jgi:hypothetical protein
MTRHAFYRFATLALALGLCGLLIAGLGVSAAGGSSVAPQQQTSTGTTTTIATQAPVGNRVVVAVYDISASTGYHWQVKPVAGIKVSYTDVSTTKVNRQNPIIGDALIRVYQLTVLQASVTPYIVQLDELTPTGQPSGTSVVVTISSQ